MINALFGNQSIVKVLYYLLVNGHCYASALRKQFGSALTPFQNALELLEREGVLMSELHGKTRLFRFDPGYPLLVDLEKLIQSAFLLLSPDEKKKYLVEKTIAGKRPLFQSERKKILLQCWEKLHEVKQFTMQARGDAFVSKGQGEVRLIKESENRILFHKKGFWISPQGHAIDFTNQVRWELNRKDSCLHYSPERRGEMHLSYAIPLSPSGKFELSTKEDQGSDGHYRGKLYLDKQALKSHWRVLTEQKNEEIECIYF